MTVPYEGATTGRQAREEIQKILKRFGCESVGFMDDYAKGELILAFSHRGRNVTMRASAKGWAALWLKEHPWTWGRSRGTAKDHEARALAQGLIAVNSVLRDWVKGQITGIECGVLQFEHVFLPYMIAADGRPVLDHVRERGLIEGPAP